MGRFLAAALLLCACSKAHEDRRCAPAATAEGLRRAGNGKLPNGRGIDPLGEQLTVGQSPMNFALSPDGSTLATAEFGVNLRGVTVVANESPMRIAQQISVRSGGYQRGIAFSADGAILWAVNTGAKRLEAYPRASGFAFDHAIDLPACDWPSDLALDGARAFVTCALSNQVIALDLSAGTQVAQVPSAAPFPQALLVTRDRLFVAQQSAPAGQPNLVAAHDKDTLQILETYAVGKNPAALATDGATLFVAASDDDAVDRIDLAAKAKLASFPLWKSGTGLTVSPNALAVAGGNLYVSAALLDAVLVLDAATGAQKGALPTGFYPTGVAVRGDSLYVVNERGNGTAPLGAGENASDAPRGTLQRLTIPADLSAATAKVEALNALPAQEYEPPDPGCEKVGPLPAQAGGESLVKHVIYVLKENKTYDSVFGDFDGSEASRAYVQWGNQITPNQHELARQFCLLDNFYVESEQSAEGHFWATANVTTDYFERTWSAAWGQNVSGRAPLVPAGLGPIDQPRSGFVFDQLAALRMPYVSYGEFVGSGLDLGRHIDFSYVDFPGNYLQRPDTEKIQIVLDAIAAGKLPAFTFLALQWDHTWGLTPGKPAPDYMIADNDRATGLLIEALTRSKQWDDTLVLITEDDPSNGADHVDAHRSFALVISPWAKRGHVSHVRASFPSLAATYQRALGLPGLNSLDAAAQPIWDCFANLEDARPFTALPSNVAPKLNPAAPIRPLDFSAVDRARGLGVELWRASRPADPVPAQILEREGDGDDD